MDIVVDPIFLTGGARGSSSNTEYLTGLSAFKGQRINIVVPLISEDGGGVSVNAVNAMVDNYAREGWTSAGKSERQAYVSKLGTKDEVKAAARTMQSEFTSLLAQDIKQLDALGNLKWFEPWGHACIYAGIHAGANAGEPTTYKVINANSVRVRDGSWGDEDTAEMVEAGVSVTNSLEEGGYRIVVANTTYGIDGNFMKNRTNVMGAAAILLYDLRNSLEKQFTGTKSKTGGAEEVLNFVKARAETYLADDIIVGNDSNKGTGYRNLTVLEDGNITRVNATFTLVEGRDFILPEIIFERNKQSA